MQSEVFKSREPLYAAITQTVLEKILIFNDDVFSALTIEADQVADFFGYAPWLEQGRPSSPSHHGGFMSLVNVRRVNAGSRDEIN